MSARARVVSIAILFSFFAFTSLVVSAQSSIDEVHITPRGKPQQLATASYDSAFSGASLLHTSVNLVLVPVSITDDRNRPVIGLDQDNFQLFENKKKQEIKNFSNEDTPVSIGILVDTSGSMSYKLQRAREAVQQFCDAANPQDEFFLVTFADTPELASDFTTDTQQITNDLLTTRSKGQTSLLDAIYMGVKKMRDAHYARKALLIISDGGDNHSRYNERDVKSAVRESDISIYAVGTYDRWVNTEEELMGPELLSTIADMTGGVSFTLNSPNDMPGVTRNIGTRLRHQYVLAYQPQSAPHDGKWHKISVKLRLPRKFPFMHVDARPGYYSGGGE